MWTAYIGNTSKFDCSAKKVLSIYNPPDCMTGISDMGPQNYSGWKGPWEVQFVVFATGLLTLLKLKMCCCANKVHNFNFYSTFSFHNTKTWSFEIRRETQVPVPTQRDSQYPCSVSTQIPKLPPVPTFLSPHLSCDEETVSRLAKSWCG